MYNVMIVDDEPVIRKGLLSFINWESLDCRVICEASNGIEAKQKLNANNIDIVITDIRMPGLDGIELTKYIYGNYPDIKIIILTAYADFSYAQSAIKHNVVDFIIKTNPTEKIPEAVNRAKELIIKQKQKEEKLKLMEEAMSENLVEIREKFIKDIFNRIIINPEVISSKLREFEIILDNYYIAAFEINYIADDSSSNFPEEQNKFIFSVKNFLSLAFKDYRHYTFMMNKDMIISVITFKAINPSVCTQSLLLMCNEILVMVDSFMKFTISIGISGMHTSPLELAQAYNESQEALSGNFYCDNNVSVFTLKTGARVGNKFIEIHKYIEEISGSLQQGYLDKALSTLLTLFDEYRGNKEPIEQVKVSCMLLCSLCFRLLANYKLDLTEHPESEAEIYKQIQDSKSIQNLYNILCNVIKSTSELITTNEKQYNYLVKEVNRYIRDNYCKDISLQSIADFVHVNSSYLSRLYKKETDESIIDTLNKYRIEIAKKFLKNPAKRIFEIAADVGIPDPAYFTHVFIKYTGISPKEFKSIS